MRDDASPRQALQLAKDYAGPFHLAGFSPNPEGTPPAAGDFPFKERGEGPAGAAGFRSRREAGALASGLPFGEGRPRRVWRASF